MPLKIIRNDITKMQVTAIVNTANENPIIGQGCDYAIYQAAGADALLNYRREHIGSVEEGEAFLTPAFALDCEYIIHAVSPLFVDGEHGEEEKLRRCYHNSLRIAAEQQFESIAMPLIATGSFGYPKEEGLRIAMDEINAFLMHREMMVFLVVFDEKATNLSKQLYPDLESYIDTHYVDQKNVEELRKDSHRDRATASRAPMPSMPPLPQANRQMAPRMSAPTFGSAPREKKSSFLFQWKSREDKKEKPRSESITLGSPKPSGFAPQQEYPEYLDSAFPEEDSSPFGGETLDERMEHLSDTFSEYLLYLIDSKGMSYPEVYKRAVVDKKAFSKIKNNKDAHPKKITAMCLCVGARLNLDQTKDLLARAGYALSPCDKRDIIFSYFIEHEIYDMIELDIQLEERGLPCLIV